MNDAPRFLFSVDLEDVRFGIADGARFRPRVPANTNRYLKWLRRHDAQATFFVVGNVAVAYPDLIRQIVDEGHEIACHTSTHVTLDQRDEASFRTDLERNLEELGAAGATDVVGFRAPTFSLTESTSWAWQVLSDLGFEYSSSVLPASSRMYGWGEFGPAPRRVTDTLIELPVTVDRFGPGFVPIFGGIYFRVCPGWVVRRVARRARRERRTLIGYLHPYDIDVDQERELMHPQLDDSRLLNWLMYYNRGAVMRRLDEVVQLGFAIQTHREHVQQLSKELT